MSWEVQYLPETEKDFRRLTKQQILRTMRAIEIVSKNPLPNTEGGYGKPLGHRLARNLTGYLKIKLQDDGIRVVYRLIRTDTVMLIVVIGIREDEEVYEIAKKRADKYHL